MSRSLFVAQAIQHSTIQFNTTDTKINNKDKVAGRRMPLPGRRTHLQTDGQPKNIMLPASAHQLDGRSDKIFLKHMKCL